MTRWLIALLIGVLSAANVHVAQPMRQTTAALYDVFYSSAINDGSSAKAVGKSGLYFVDARTGLSAVAITNGVNYTLLNDSVIFSDKQSGQSGVAYPDGRVLPHPFLPVGAVWAASTDRTWLAWSTAHTENGSLLTDLYVAHPNGDNKQLALHTSSSKAISVRPLAVTNDGLTVFYTRQAVDPKASSLYVQAADLYRLTVATGEVVHLNGEPRCACAAAFSADGRLLLRLESTFAAHVIDLSVNVDVRADPLTGYTQAGDAVLSDKGTFGAYSAAKVTASGQQFALIVVDSSAHKQRVLLDFSANRLRPLLFERNALIAIGVDKDGTYKVALTDGTLTQVSANTFLGSLSG